MKAMLFNSLLIIFSCIISGCNCQMGPEPWDVKSSSTISNKDDVPPDLRIPQKVIEPKESSQGMSDWFYKRLLAIVIKGGQKKDNEDSSIDVALQMKYNQEQIDVLNSYIESNDALSEEMLRRSIHLIEDAIYKPTITEKIVLAWNEYIYTYLVEYRTYLTWGSSILACITGTFWLWQYISYKHILILLGVSLYLYEVFISYKEAEKEELDRFLSSVSTCKWFFWTSECEVAPPDPLIMLKHMNPLKIGLRMFTSIISEPMVTLSATVNTMIYGITADLMFPFDKITRIILVLMFNALLIFMLVSIIFNYILNIPFQLNFLNVLSIALPTRDRSIKAPMEHSANVHGDRITGETLNKVLDVCSKALNATQVNNNFKNQKLSLMNTGHSALRKSASASRLSDLISNVTNNNLQIDYKKRAGGKGRHKGGGDARC